VNAAFLNIAPSLALVLVTATLYLPSLDNPLIWDDQVHVVQAGDLGLAGVLTRDDAAHLRPTVRLSYLAHSVVGLDSAAALHLANVVLHAANAVLVCLLLVRLAMPVAAAFAAALVFAVHPLQSAAVAYVSGRADILAALFTLLAVHLVLGRGRDGGSAAVLGRAALVAALVACAAGASEGGLMAGPLVAALWWTDRDGRPAVAGYAVPVVALLTSLALAVVIVPAAALTLAAGDPATSLRVAGTAFATYVRLLVLPLDLHLDRLTPLGGTAYLSAGVVVVLATVWALVAFVGKPGRMRFGGLALALLYLPASGLVRIYPMVAERWVFTPESLVYMPLAVVAAFVCLDVMTGIDELAERRGLARHYLGASAALTLAVIVAGLSVGPVRARQASLTSAENAYATTLAHSPSPRACFNLGVALLGEGDADEAITIYERCARVSPNDADVFVQLGVAYQRAGKIAEAKLAYQKALALDAGNALAWSNHASLDASTGAYAQAREKWRRALAIDPGFKPALDGMAELERADL
jgi:hypothetical protein